MDIRKLKTGRDIAQFLRESKQKWTRKLLARGDSRCVMGQIASAAGISNMIMRKLGQTPQGMATIVQANDVSSSKEGAAYNIESNYGDRDYSEPLHNWLTELCKLQKAADKNAATSKSKVVK